MSRSSTHQEATVMASEDLLKKAVAAFKALSPDQQAEMLEEQRQSWVRGNIGLSRDERGMTSTVMHRPAPAATDTGLETFSVEVTSSGHPYMKSDPDGDYVTRSQAEEILAAEREKKDELEAAWLTAEGIISDLKAENERLRLNAHTHQRQFSAANVRAKNMTQKCLRLEADNAALTARVKELEEINADLCRSHGVLNVTGAKLEGRVEALEAKLAAAEKALKTARPYVEDYDTRRHNTGVDETLTQIDAALGGKPS
ncbi:hypothetical protein L614_002400000050 [Ochrobactrum sp. J50]|uniref:hypothetical protein n=1 Tax=Ochrobactrum sp. J50 TaxID=936132 RepID=UPI00119E09EA|nr:hypothetical protein [Ochrobactrum sp. J50]TWH01400.1 hypothetical protein L614_002400000050 [Ochrobactrum sp. J50]